jgi:pyruvate/2-oxoglutarate dehydrogenase complex dihydrolipoamide acyltransferase (E2) component
VNVEVRLPKWGMGINEGTIVRWLKAVGDEVAEGEPLVEVETAKATDYVNAPSGGILIEIVAGPGTVVPVLEVLAIIEAPAD